MRSGDRPLDAASLQQDVPFGRDIQTADAIEQGGLAGAIGPDNGHDRSGFNGAVYLLDRPQAAKDLGNTGDVKNRMGHNTNFRPFAVRCLAMRPEAKDPTPPSVAYNAAPRPG